MKAKYYRRFLTIAYWNMYTEMLSEPEENGSHILPFIAMTSLGMGFIVGYLILFEFTTGVKFPFDLDFRITLGMALGAYLTYMFFVKSERFRDAKILLHDLNFEDKKSVCTACGLMAVTFGMSPFFLGLIVAFFYAMK